MIICLLVASFLFSCSKSDTSPRDNSVKKDIIIFEDVLLDVAETNTNGLEQQKDMVIEVGGDNEIDYVSEGEESIEKMDFGGEELILEIEETCDGDSAGISCPEDDLICTKVYKDEEGECVTLVLENFCLIENKCYFILEPSPSNQCLFCNPLVDQYGFVPNSGLPCDDGDLCTVGDMCGPDGECIGGPQADCDDGNECTIDKCIKGLVGCVHQPFVSTCDDKNKCTYQDHCENGKCIGKKLPCDDKNPCTDDSCDPKIGCKFLPNTNKCDDNDPCTIEDKCDKGVCKGIPLNCDDGNPCTKDYCLPGAAGCVHDPLFGQCDDNNACTTSDHCTQDNECVGYEKECDDFNICTDDSCDPNVGCIFTPNQNYCDDGDPCTLSDKCVAGICIGEPKDCDDGIPCTIDTCHPLYGCQHVLTSGQCDDKNACTEGDTCATGVCIGMVKDCNDHNVCTKDECDPKVGCIHIPQPGICDDGDPCTEGDHCEDGECVSSPKDCNDNDLCSKDYCGEGGMCFHEKIWGECDDGNPCTQGDECVTGECKGYPADCNDDNPCTIDSCDPKIGCVHTPDPKATTCDDHSVCTVNDHCEQGKCVGIPITCNDNNPCTKDQCDPKKGCLYQEFEGQCDDGELCTTDDYCIQGKCIGKSLLGNPSHNTSKLAFGVSGNPGQGLDIDDNLDTCAPKGSCVQGIDNGFAKIAWLFNPELTNAAKEGKIAVLLGHDHPDFFGQPYKINIYWGKKVDKEDCDHTKDMCSFRVFNEDLAGSCTPKWVFDNATFEGTKLTLGGKGYQVPVYLVLGTLRIPMMLKWAKIVAMISNDGENMGEGTGILGGVFNRLEFINAVSAIPADKFPPPYTKEIVLQYLELYLATDIDADNDGTKESTSVGIVFSIVPGYILGELK